MTGIKPGPFDIRSNCTLNCARPTATHLAKTLLRHNLQKCANLYNTNFPKIQTRFNYVVPTCLATHKAPTNLDIILKTVVTQWSLPISMDQVQIQSLAMSYSFSQFSAFHCLENTNIKNSTPSGPCIIVTHLASAMDYSQQGFRIRLLFSLIQMHLDKILLRHNL